MLRLLRTVRFCLSRSRRFFGNGASADDHTGCNTFAGWPTMHGFGVYYSLDVECQGEADEVTGYFMNITEIDQAVRAEVLPRIERAFHDTPDRDPATLLPDLLLALQPALRESVVRIRWHLSPYYSVMIEAPQPNRVLMTESFEFAAAHRLDCPTLSPEENRAVFGKCNNPNGHGHNYVLEVTISKRLNDSNDQRFTPLILERIVKQAVLDRLDHKHLNMDVPEFADRNPSVEVIAEVCFGMLKESIARAGPTLERVSVWETGKTCCTYPAQ